MASTRSFGLDVGTYGRLATPEAVLDVARLAEELDFDSIWLPDHVAFPVALRSVYPYSATGAFPADLSEPLLEPIATLGVLAGATKRVKLGTAVLVMPYRNPVLLARMLVTLDQFSGGRIVLGAGVGWLAEEFELLGAPAFAQRGRVTDEYLEIVKAICAGGTVAYHGQTYRFDAIHAVPGSLQRPHPPLLIGGLADPALRRVARLADGWLAVTIGPTQLPERLAALRRFCTEHGRRYDDLTLVHKLFLSIGEPKPSGFGERAPGTGSIPEIIDDLKTLFDLGFQTVIVRYHGTTVAEQRAAIERFASDIIPKV
ncbi:MAG: TIGR03619 family F420-dependent LLM class oxidoreductase [Proteobacteria bacterium]|nr:TIGR03619 family F420-dependent LLM class oxidoreductase [Pseudomonadota bacterium]